MSASDVDNSERPTAPRRRLTTDRLADSVMILLAVTVVQRTVGFGRSVLFCRWLEPEQLGQWDMAYSFLLLAAPLAVLGLPGSFGRYLEYYRQRGQLQTFLRRTTTWTAILSIAAVTTIASAPTFFSQLVFGRSDRTLLVVLLAVSLAAVVLHHFLESLFTALRMYRVVSLMQFSQSLGFALIGIGLLTTWKLGAASVILAYGSSSLLSAVGALTMARLATGDLTRKEQPVPHRAFWPKLVRFAAWVWVANVLAHLFAIVDRYMLIHYGNMDVAEAMVLVGHYHSSRIVPLLLVAVADLLGSMITPHLSQDWEAGLRALANSISL